VGVSSCQWVLWSRNKKRKSMNAEIKVGGKEKGSVLLESAIVLPILMLFVFGIVQFGMLLAAHIAMHNASALAVREAVVHLKDTEDVRQAAIDALKQSSFFDSQVLDANPESIVNVDPNFSVGGESATRVSIEYQMPVLLRMIIPSATITLRASSVMR